MPSGLFQISDGVDRRPAGRGSPSRIAASERVLHHGGERAQIVHAVFVHEGQQPLGAERVGGDEGMDVAEHLVAFAHVLGDEREQVLVRHARRGTSFIGGIWMPSS